MKVGKKNKRMKTKIRQTNRTIFVVKYINYLENQDENEIITLFASEDEETADLYVYRFNELLLKLIEHYGDINSNWYSKERNYEVKQIGGCWYSEVRIRNSTK